ncbi:nicotinamide-nucleotide amidohydrolase family protein [Microvirga tunisiensis]|uniref:Nicotinamide-nucleotide amidohydrolase family protein n=1 Tax=Pannonibacter tanglangensis TaxID=2750084 RepID=A0A7X5F3E8_9HYPH|nr:CinA family protein [Pannonibacter sp. XCT-53]NBN77784.1 nicotinamide-nucleotide amidohydrolase family protein [Pannonibacter sp. XCT-53]
MTDLDPLLAETAELVKRMAEAGLTLATAESCTGGLVAGLVTEVPGSSAVLDRGFVTYSNAAKAEMLGVPMALITEHGAVSRPVAIAMAEGALAHSQADVAVAITGIAGPGGGSEAKPVGTVHFACAARGHPTVADAHRFADNGRAAIRADAVRVALQLVSNFTDVLKGSSSL